MKMLACVFIILVWLQVNAFAAQAIRNDKPFQYIIIYYRTTYAVPVSNDRYMEYIIIPGDFGSVDLAIGYDIAPTMYPISQGLPYQWRIQNTESHYMFKKDKR